MKNKILIVLMLVLLVMFLVNDIALLLKLSEKTQIFSNVTGFSYFHYLLVGVYKFEFSVFKLGFTALVMVLWVLQLFRSCFEQALATITACYVMFWLLLTILIASTIAGILQQVAGVPVDLLNPVPILANCSGGYANLLLYISMGLSLPLLVFVISSVYASQSLAGISTAYFSRDTGVRDSMIKEKLVATLLIVVFYVLSGALVWCLYQIQHIVEADWAKLTSYLVVIPLIKLVSLLPGVVVGYLLGARQWFVVVVAGFLSYAPYQMAGKMDFSIPTSIPTIMAQGISLAVVTLLALWAGTYLRTVLVDANKLV